MPVMPFLFYCEYFDESPCEGRVLDVFVPPSATRECGLFFVHGGGWRSGSRSVFHAIMKAFAAAGFICGSTDYRLNNANIQTQLGDVREGYHLFLQALAEHRRPRRAIAIGSSAGGHLAALLALARPGQCGESISPDIRDAPAPLGLVAQSCPTTFEPWEDIFPPIWEAMQGIVGGSYAQEPERFRAVSPIHLLSEDSPPVLLLHAENEHMFPLANTLRFVEAARCLGRRADYVVYPRMEHGFFYDLQRPQQKAAFADILAFVASLGLREDPTLQLP